jgi:hypothetical protein
MDIQFWPPFRTAHFGLREGLATIEQLHVLEAVLFERFPEMRAFTRNLQEGDWALMGELIPRNCTGVVVVKHPSGRHTRVYEDASAPNDQEGSK